jgi:hypothetical protein
VHPKPFGSTDAEIKARSHLKGNSERTSIIDADDD